MYSEITIIAVMSVVGAVLIGGLAWWSRVYERRQLAAGQGYNEQTTPATPAPARQPARPQAAPAVVLQPSPAYIPPGPTASAAPLNPRAATLAALATMPAGTPPVAPPPGEIALLCDYQGRRWHPVILGKDGHWGIFGASGSGKGNALQLIALDALRMGPEQARLVVLDPKDGLDYGFCELIEHATLYPAGALSEGYNGLVDELQRRNAVLRTAVNPMTGIPGARNIGEYASWGNTPMPLLVVIADEVAELNKQQREALATLARMGRAAGLVLFIATQHPTADVLPTQIQANVLNRLVLRLASSSYASVALKRTAADNPTYEPSAIDRPGVAILRAEGGREILGRVPEISDETRAHLITALAQKWPKLSNISAAQSTTQPPDGKVPDDDLARFFSFLDAPGSDGSEKYFDEGAAPARPQNHGTTPQNQARNQQSTAPGTANDPSPEPPAAVGGLSAVERAAVEKWLTDGRSANAIAADLKGNRAARLAQIRAIKQNMEASDSQPSIEEQHTDEAA